jgi:hypothetical protein
MIENNADHMILAGFMVPVSREVGGIVVTISILYKYLQGATAKDIDMFKREKQNVVFIECF